jgi:hypothetical protein
LLISPLLKIKQFLTRLYQGQAPAAFTVSSYCQFLLLAFTARKFLDISIDESEARFLPNDWFIGDQKSIATGLNISLARLRNRW